jgi:GNAT superfamily N-acetyltransferase
VLSVAIADPNDLSAYVAMAKEAQSLVRARNLTQWVPAAHENYMSELRTKFAKREVHKVVSDGAIDAFFVATTEPSEWWTGWKGTAFYLSGMVVSRAARGRNIGRRILTWCNATALERGLGAVRLDCHAHNAWLCDFYRSAGFEERAQLEQYPGYIGALFERRVTS